LKGASRGGDGRGDGAQEQFLAEPRFGKRNVIDYILRRSIMSLGTILLIVLILILVGAIPTWPHSSGWGYYPSGTIGLVLVVVLILILLGKI